MTSSQIVRRTAAVRRKIPRALLAAFDARAKAWRLGRIATCPTQVHACLAAADQHRKDELAAIENQITEQSPPIENLSAYVLKGSFKIRATIDSDHDSAADAAPSPLDRFPKPGTVVRAEGARICFDGNDCRDIGWTKHRLDWLPRDGEREQRALRLPKEAVVFSGIFDDRVPRLTLILRLDGHLLAERDLCNARGDVCRTVYQDWAPIGTAAMVDLSR